MFHRFALFLFCLLWPALGLAGGAFQLGTSYPPTDLTEFVLLLENHLQQQVDLSGVDSARLDLLLQPDAPARQDKSQSALLGMVPFADGRIGYLYQRSARAAEARKALDEALDDWLLPYQPQRPQFSELGSVGEAVAAARNGHFSQALGFLYPYLEKHHRNVRAHAETIVVLEWAGRYQDVLALAFSRSDLELPLYAIKSVVRSARAGEYWPAAEEFLQTGLRHAPNDPELLSLQVHIWADQGRLDDGLLLVEQALQDYPEYADLWLAKYYLHTLRQESYDALDAIQRAYQLVPSRYARRELSFSLARCGMPQQALQLLLDDPGLLSPDERFRLRRQAHAMQVRWGVFEQPTQKQHYAETDSALSQSDELFAELVATDFAQEEVHQRSLLFDRLVALRDRRQMQEVVDQWEFLKYGEIEIPDYALLAIADALLYLQRPEEAAELYAGIAERNRNNASAWLGLYYSLHEANRYDEATALLEKLITGEALWEQSKGYRQPQRNQTRDRFELAAALDRLYRNEPGLAEERLAPMFHQGPHNPALRRAYAELERARRHPRHAQTLAEQGLAVNPKDGGLQVELADSYLARYQWRLAEKSIARQVELFPEEASTIRLQDEWQRHNLRILEGRISFGYGESPDVDGQEIDWLLRNWTRPLDYDWRLAVFGLSRHAELPEGRATRTYAGVAAQRLTSDLSLFAQLGVADVSNERWMAEFSGRYELSDSWALPFGVALNGEAVSLRALETGSSGVEYRLGVEWWRHESLSANAGVSLLDYSDGNLRTALSAAVRKRVRTGPTFQLENILRAASSNNSSQDGAYFAPEADFLVENELQARWISWRRYGDTFTQRASASLGGYWQQDYDWSVPFAFSYAHEWELKRRRFFVEYGPSYSYRHYDGEAENKFGFYLAFIWRY